MKNFGGEVFSQTAVPPYSSDHAKECYAISKKKKKKIERKEKKALRKTLRKQFKKERKKAGVGWLKGILIFLTLSVTAGLVVLSWLAGYGIAWGGNSSLAWIAFIAGVLISLFLGIFGIIKISRIKDIIPNGTNQHPVLGTPLSKRKVKSFKRFLFIMTFAISIPLSLLTIAFGLTAGGLAIPLFVGFVGVIWLTVFAVKKILPIEDVIVKKKGD